MIKVRIIYTEEFIALSRLFFLIEDRPLQSKDYRVENGYFILLNNVSSTLTNILRQFEEETIWAAAWIQGPIRKRLLKNNDDIPWIVVYGPVIFIDRNYYSKLLSLISTENEAMLYLPDSDRKRIITGGLIWEKDKTHYELPEPLLNVVALLFGSNNVFISIKMIETYLLGWPYFIFPDNLQIEKIKSGLIKNYRNTKSRRVRGNRRIICIANFGTLVKLDSYDELISLLQLLSSDNSSLSPTPSKSLRFPENLQLVEDDQKIWRTPIRVGEEDIHLELSYYRETGQLDSEYEKYREICIQKMDECTKEWLIHRFSEK